MILNINQKNIKIKINQLFQLSLENILESKWYSKTDIVDINQIEKISNQLHTLLYDLVNYVDKKEQPNYF